MSTLILSWLLGLFAFQARAEDAWTRHNLSYPSVLRLPNDVSICNGMEEMSRNIFSLVSPPDHCMETKNLERSVRSMDRLLLKACQNLEIGASRLLDVVAACQEARAATPTEVEHLSYFNKWLKEQRMSASSEFVLVEEEDFDLLEKEAENVQCAWNSAMLLQFRKRQLDLIHRAFSTLEASVFACQWNGKDKEVQIRTLREELL